MSRLTIEDNDFAAYVSGNYKIEPESIEDAAILYAGGVNADEVSVFLLTDSADISGFVENLNAYIDNRMVTFYGYMPDEALLLERAIVSTRNNYVALLICEDPSDAENAFFEAFDAESTMLNINIGSSDTTAQQSAGAAGRYNPDAILNAWHTGDDAELTNFNQSILQTAVNVIDEVTTDAMSDYEKELAIHDWIIEWTQYDPDALSQSPSARPNSNNDNPYGLLIDGVAICSGYTSTFQLFMDMLGIECITVNGTAYDDVTQHAWNMVRLDGEWYCVDITWDDPTSEYEIYEWDQHQYFNVTSQFMRSTNHYWNENLIPNANAVEFGWQ